MQPRSRAIRYDNVRSAAAEESLLAQVLQEPALLDQLDLKPGEFSSSLLGRGLRQLSGPAPGGSAPHPGRSGRPDADEAAHMAAILQRHQGPVNESALRDCAATIRREHLLSSAEGAQGLLAIRDALQKKIIPHYSDSQEATL